MAELLRAAIFHTPRNAFRDERALEAWSDGGLLVDYGVIVECGDFAPLHKAHADAAVTDLRGGVLIPGLIDTHVHFPQVRIMGALGRSLLDWLERVALPEESRMSNSDYARDTARLFVDALRSNGTTTALVFGSHFSQATTYLFEAAASAGLRLVSGLVLADRGLRPDLHQTPEAAYRASTEMIGRFHHRGRLLYAVTPRFAVSASEAMLEVCQTLMREHAGLRFQTHINENREEIAEVARLFPWASDYLAVYERYSLCGRHSVLAHSVHPRSEELQRMAAAQVSVAHCPASNAALGSGIFSLRRHLESGVRCALGTDVGAGIGFGVLKEGLQAYLMQRVAPEPMVLSAAQLLYLATRAGAEALGLDGETGDFSAGKAADFVYLRPRQNTPLSEAIARVDDLDGMLATLFTLADQDSIAEVRVAGDVIYARDPR